MDTGPPLAKLCKDHRSIGYENVPYGCPKCARQIIVEFVRTNASLADAFYKGPVERARAWLGEE